MTNNSVAIQPQSTETEDNHNFTYTMPRKDREEFVDFAQGCTQQFFSEENPNRENVAKAVYKFAQSALILTHAMSMRAKGHIAKRPRPKQRRQKKDQLLLALGSHTPTTSPQTPSVRGNGFYQFVIKFVTPQLREKKKGKLDRGEVQRLASKYMKDPARWINYAHQYISDPDFKRLLPEKMRAFCYEVKDSQGFKKLSPDQQAAVNRNIQQVLEEGNLEG